MKGHLSTVIKLFCLLSAFSLLLPLNGCDSSNAGEAQQAWPKKLTIAFTSSSEDDPEGRFAAYQELGKYLQEEIGIPVKVIRNLSYAPVIEAMRSGKIDLAQAGSFSYVIARQKAGVEPLVTRGTSEGLGLYTSIIATSPKTGLRTLDEVLAKSQDLVFSFVDPASTSGHLIPRAGLESMNVDVDRDFKQVVYAMNHTNSAMTILSAKVDVGAMSRSSWDKLVKRGKVKADDVKILWESKPIPQGPIMARSGLPEELKQRITAAFIKLNEGGPLLEQLATAANKPDLRFYQADDAMYDGLREIARNLDNMQLLTSL